MPAFDVNAVCSGFLYGLTVVEGLLADRFRDRYALLVGADMFSAIMDRSDRRTVSLFGDAPARSCSGRCPRDTASRPFA